MMDPDVGFRESLPSAQKFFYSGYEIIPARVDRRMRRKTRGFIDENQIFVFEQNVIRCQLEAHVSRCRVAKKFLDIDMRFNRCTSLHTPGGDRHSAFFHEDNSGDDELSRLCFRYRTL